MQAEEQISGRKLSLFCLDEDCTRQYLVTLKKELTEEGTSILPIFSEDESEAFTFGSVEMASKYFSFLTENITEFDFFYCILPEAEEKISEEEKELDSNS